MCAAIHEALVAELSRIQNIDVISRTSVMRYEQIPTSLSPRYRARTLDVDAIVEGSVSRAGESLTVTAQLVAADPERHLWAQRFHRNTADVFEITTEVARSIAAEIAADLSAAEEAFLATSRRVNADAYDAYLLGRFHFESRSPGRLSAGTGALSSGYGYRSHVRARLRGTR